MNFLEFSRKLILSKDLDPVYVGITEVLDPTSWKDPERDMRWLLSYMMFYHVGFSCWVYDQPESDFWNILEAAAANHEEAPNGGRWPRASERRHFRGNFARWSVEKWKVLVEGNGGSIARVIKKISDESIDSMGAIPVDKFRLVLHDLPSFGDWATFKMSDLLERCWEMPIEFRLNGAMYSKPEEGVKLYIEKNYPDRVGAARDMKIYRTWEDWTNEVGSLLAPPRMERPVGPQEFETCLCKWVSHKKGRYPVGKDIKEVMHASYDWTEHSPTAQKFWECMDVLLETWNKAEAEA